MKLTHSDVEASSKTNVGRLQTWLDYELSGIALLLASYFYFFTLYLAIIAALVFILLLLKVLFEEKRYGWLLSFFLFIAVPPLAVYLLLDNTIWAWVASFVSLGSFYTYCAILKLIIPNW